MWCYIIPFITAIIGAILGWLLRHLTCKCDDEKTKYEQLLAENKKLDIDLKAAHSKNQKLNIDLSDCMANNTELISNKNKFEAGAKAASNILQFTTLEKAEPSLVFDGDTAKQFLGKKIVADNLTVVEGIGPKIAELFNNAGINTWYQLSETSIEKCQEILDDGGPRFAIHKPATWPKQALLAFEGKWEELNTWQDELDGGK